MCKTFDTQLCEPEFRFARSGNQDRRVSATVVAYNEGQVEIKNVWLLPGQLADTTVNNNRNLS